MVEINNENMKNRRIENEFNNKNSNNERIINSSNPFYIFPYQYYLQLAESGIPRRPPGSTKYNPNIHRLKKDLTKCPFCGRIIVNPWQKCPECGDYRQGIRLGSILSGGAYSEYTPRNSRVLGDFIVSFEALIRHLGILGDVGSGKTTLIFWILRDVLEHGIHFTAFEAAKDEYRNLWNTCNILHFTVGIEYVNPFRFNFLEVPEGVPVSGHIGNIVAAFQHAFAMPEILVMILEETIVRVYQEKGWNLTDNIPPVGTDIYPRPSELLDKFKTILKERGAGTGYAGELATNIPSFLTSRLLSLLRMGRGKMFDCPRSIPLKELYTKNVVFELQGLGNDDQRRLFVALFLTIYGEFLTAQGLQEGLRHLTVIEEAHRILGTPLPSNVEGSSTIGQKASEVIKHLIAEARALGEGIIIADQNPKELPDGIVALLGSLITPGLKSKELIRKLGDHFGLLELPKLPPGIAVAAMYDSRYPLKITFPPLPLGKQKIPDADICYHMAPFYQANLWIYEVDKQEDFEIGLGDSELDPALKGKAALIDKNCAKIIYTIMVHKQTRMRSPNNPFLLQNKTYALKQCYKEITITKLASSLGRTWAASLQDYLKKIEGETGFNANKLREIYPEIMHFAVQDISPPEPVVPLPAVIYFLISLVFKALNFAINQRWYLFTQLIRVLTINGWPSLAPTQNKEAQSDGGVSRR